MWKTNECSLLQPSAEQVFPREELPGEPAVAGQVQRQREPAHQGPALSHAGLRQPGENICRRRIKAGGPATRRLRVFQPSSPEQTE